MDAATYVGLSLTIVSTIRPSFSFEEKLLPTERLSSRFATKSVIKTTTRLIRENLPPASIAEIECIGAIMSSLVSGPLDHRRLSVVTEKGGLGKGTGLEGLIPESHVPRRFFDRIFPVSENVHIRRTIDTCSACFKNARASDIRIVTPLCEVRAARGVNHGGLTSRTKDVILPSLIVENYLPADRDPPLHLISGDGAYHARNT